MIRGPMDSVRDWLGRVPIDDPVERRNAPFLQVVLMVFGVVMPINLYYYLRAVGLVLDSDPVASVLHLITDLAIILAAWSGVFLIRRGHLRLAVKLFLGAILCSLTLNFLQKGVHGLRVLDPTFPVLCLVLSGLILGRGAMWKVFAWVIGMLAIGVARDVIVLDEPPSFPYAPTVTFHVTLLYLVIAMSLDRTVAALQGSLTETVRQGHDLAETNRLLEQEMAERELAHEKLIHAQKMEAVGKLASGVAHDFDNVLSVILGYAARRERIAEQGAGALVKALEGVELAARRGLSISRKTLNLSRQDFSRPETFDAVAALRELQPLLRQLFDGDAQVRLDVPDAALPIHMDRGQFELIVLNIAANARDAMPMGGQFTILANRAEDTSSMELALCDSGSGMPERVRARVFDPFYTTKPVGSGTGLGLTLVRDIVQTAHGTISVDSVPGEGTAVRLGLPLAAIA